MFRINTTSVFVTIFRTYVKYSFLHGKGDIRHIPVFGNASGTQTV